eukprot:5723023-Prymnesium_polylepis.1
MMNARDVWMLLFESRTRHTPVPRAHVTDSQIRRLAYLIGATGGTGDDAPARWDPTWYGRGKATTLAWTAQRST